ncbi:DUF1177 domain-containing protein [Massilia antarctica]|nr:MULTISPECIES: DUF1177 domain-containing protein [Massilia]MCY0915219.1 hypothetical protein [Massilia sp. H27-R4]CUI05731.1 hypothetical protein BN2497_6239 [Janthinobacterium sp. CG23_2]CUU29517.1 hypothetical protein BN3177_6239 [Janthinobacterium sp. CG23_2]
MVCKFAAWRKAMASFSRDGEFSALASGAKLAGLQARGATLPGAR